MKEEHRIMLAAAESEKGILERELKDHPHDPEEKQWKISRISECQCFIVDIKRLYSRKNPYGLKPITSIKLRSAWDSVERHKIYKYKIKPR